MKKGKSTSWQWFSVKLIFEDIVSGEPKPDSIDENYNNSFRNFNESIVIVKAQSYSHAYKIAEKKAGQMELEYTNPYGELVTLKFDQAIDCYRIGEEILDTGLEVYWRQLRVAKNMDTEDFIDRYYPETVDDSDGVFYNSILLNNEFSYKTNPKE